MPFDWWTKRVRVNKPIDWANTWSLEAQARGLSFEMDDQHNLKAMPVVVVDTNTPNIIPARQTGENKYIWEQSQLFTDATAVLFRGQSCYVTQIQVDYSDAVLAAAAAVRVDLTDGTTAPIRWTHHWYCAAAAAFRPSHVISFYPPLYCYGTCVVQNFTAYASGGIEVTVWGYDA